MPISGLVLTLSADPALAAAATAALDARPEITPGAARERWLPVALDANDDTESRALHDWLQALPGVEFVDVVYVNFETDSVAPAAAEPQPIPR